MIEFKPIDLDDRDIFKKYLGSYNFNTYEYSFLTLYLWRKLCCVEYTILDDVLIIKKTEKDKGSYFMQPLGYKKENLKDIVEKLKCIKQECSNMKCLFRDVEEPFLQELKEIFGDDLSLCEDINNFDYIYESEKLISLSGRKLHGKKNHFNQFIASYNPVIKDANDKRVMKECMDFVIQWYENKEEKSEELSCEVEGIKDVLNNFQYLNALGMAVYVDDKVAGFTIGERVNDSMGIIHIEKGDWEYKGIYAYINKIFAEKYLSDVTLINREEDLGIEGLRQAKSSYHPLKLEKKYIVDIA